MVCVCVADVSGGDSRTSSPLFHLPAEFFHPTTAAIPQGSPATGAAQPGSRHASPASWASLRSPGANSRVMCSQVRHGTYNIIRTYSHVSRSQNKDEGVSCRQNLTSGITCGTAYSHQQSSTSNRKACDREFRESSPHRICRVTTESCSV